MITFKLYRENGALNSTPVFDAFEASIKKTGNSVVTDNEDVAVIWSALWHGRMQPNNIVYHTMRAKNKPVIIIEVGNLKRNITWRIGINHVNRLGMFGNNTNLDVDRPAKLGISLTETTSSRPEILIAGQHEKSLQWQGQPSTQHWVNSVVTQIRNVSDLPITFRPHPRASYVVTSNLNNVKIELPKKIQNTYDNFNFDYKYHCIINYNSGPSVQSVLHGTPTICDISSLAFPVSNNLSDINNLVIPDRSNWLIELCHTEWTIPEIISGIPLLRLIPILHAQLT